MEHKHSIVAHNTHFSKEDTQMAREAHGRMVSPGIRDMQARATGTHCFTPTGTAVMQSTENNRWRGC